MRRFLLCTALLMAILPTEQTLATNGKGISASAPHHGMSHEWQEADSCSAADRISTRSPRRRAAAKLADRGA